jgi:hypothetical protein
MPAGTLKLACSVCGTVNSKGQHNGQCDHGCFTVATHLEWNALTRKLVIKHHALVPYLARYRTFDQLTAFVRSLR